MSSMSVCDVKKMYLLREKVETPVPSFNASKFSHRVHPLFFPSLSLTLHKCEEITNLSKKKRMSTNNARVDQTRPKYFVRDVIFILPIHQKK